MNDSTAPSWDPELEFRYAPLVEKLEQLLPCLEVQFHLPWIDAINTLKRERGAVIMAHSYQSPENFHGEPDVTGESQAHAQNRQVTLQFRVPDEETLALLRELKPSLYEGLEKKGYHLVDLKARTSDAEPISPLSAAREARGRMGLGDEGGFDIRL